MANGEMPIGANDCDTRAELTAYAPVSSRSVSSSGGGRGGGGGDGSNSGLEYLIGGPIPAAAK